MGRREAAVDSKNVCKKVGYHWESIPMDVNSPVKNSIPHGALGPKPFSQ
jgi:hypothetical protein